MNIELVLSPELYASRQLTENHAAVAVDVLRATTAICAAFKAGAASILPLDSLLQLAELHGQGYTIAAERNGLKLPLATCGNSPTEYLSMNLTGKKLAYSTTNGTVAILRATDANPLFVGAFANIGALTERLSALNPQNLVILCSGWHGDPSIEDTLFAGALIHNLLPLHPCLVNDSAQMALDLWLSAHNDLDTYCAKASHVQRLIRLGAEKDIRFSLQFDTCLVVPQYQKEFGCLTV